MTEFQSSLSPWVPFFPRRQEPALHAEVENTPAQAKTSSESTWSAVSLEEVPSTDDADISASRIRLSPVKIRHFECVDERRSGSEGESRHDDDNYNGGGENDDNDDDDDAVASLTSRIRVDSRVAVVTGGKSPRTIDPVALILDAVAATADEEVDETLSESHDTINILAELSSLNQIEESLKRKGLLVIETEPQPSKKAKIVVVDPQD